MCGETKVARAKILYCESFCEFLSPAKLVLFPMLDTSRYMLYTIYSFLHAG